MVDIARIHFLQPGPVLTWQLLLNVLKRRRIVSWVVFGWLCVQIENAFLLLVEWWSGPRSIRGTTPWEGCGVCSRYRDVLFIDVLPVVWWSEQKYLSCQRISCSHETNWANNLSLFDWLKHLADWSSRVVYFGQMKIDPLTAWLIERTDLLLSFFWLFCGWRVDWNILFYFFFDNMVPQIFTEVVDIRRRNTGWFVFAKYETLLP